jgi:hypothetical protein
MTPFDAPGLFGIRLDDTHRLRARGEDGDAARREGRAGQLAQKRTHPPSQLHTLAKWSRFA